MSNIFDAYDSEFNDLHRDLSKTINELRNNTDSNQNIQTRQIDGLFSQVNDLLKQMEVELRSLDSATRKALSKKVASYKNTLSSLKSDYNSVREQSDKSTLMGGKSGEQRQRLLDTNEK